MITKYLSELWIGVAPGLADHLWQSTLFVIAAGVLTLTLRGNRAESRYRLWLAASVKFLVPFSLLAAVGSHLHWAGGTEVTNAERILPSKKSASHSHNRQWLFGPPPQMFPSIIYFPSLPESGSSGFRLF